MGSRIGLLALVMACAGFAIFAGSIGRMEGAVPQQGARFVQAMAPKEGLDKVWATARDGTRRWLGLSTGADAGQGLAAAWDEMRPAAQAPKAETTRPRALRGGNARQPRSMQGVVRRVVK